MSDEIKQDQPMQVPMLMPHPDLLMRLMALMLVRSGSDNLVLDISEVNAFAKEHNGKRLVIQAEGEDKIAIRLLDDAGLQRMMLAATQPKTNVDGSVAHDA